MSKKYEDMNITDFLNLASQSSDEMGSLGGGRMVDYETGKYFDVRDEETAVFVASARNIVEALCKRLSKCEAQLSAIVAIAHEHIYEEGYKGGDFYDALVEIKQEANKGLNNENLA